jgi:hypothetical protein
LLCITRHAIVTFPGHQQRHWDYNPWGHSHKVAIV